MTLLKDKIIFISGASSGIGAACAKQFARLGAKLILCARTANALHSLSEQLKKEYAVESYCFSLDVRDQNAVQKAIQTLPAPWQAIDLLINNAGLAAGLDPIQQGSIQDWEDMIDTNVKGVLYLTKAILPQMIKRNTGHIINMGSIAGHETYPRGAVYCATKAAVDVLSDGLRMDLLGTQIRVSTVDPGMVKTNFSQVRFKGDTQRADEVYKGVEALTADDIADTIIYCATRPAHVNISHIIIMPTDQASATLVSRKEKS